MGITIGIFNIFWYIVQVAPCIERATSLEGLNIGNRERSGLVDGSALLNILRLEDTFCVVLGLSKS